MLDNEESICLLFLLCFTFLISSFQFFFLNSLIWLVRNVLSKKTHIINNQRVCFLIFIVLQDDIYSYFMEQLKLEMISGEDLAQIPLLKVH